MTARAGKQLTINSDLGGVVIVTCTTADQAAATDTPCLSCLVALQTGTDTVYMNIGAAATNAKWKLSSTAIPVPVTNLNLLHFLGGSGSEKVQILYRI